MATRKDDDKPAATKPTKAEAEAALSRGELTWREYLAAVDAADKDD